MNWCYLTSQLPSVGYRQIAEAVGVNAFTQRRVVQVEIPGLKSILSVDISGARIGKNKFHKLVRYQRGEIPQEIEPEIHGIVEREVGRYLSR